MRAGELDRRVRLEANTPSIGETGEEIEAWAEFDTVWAKRRDTRGREYFAGTEAPGQETAEATAVYTIRWRDGLQAEMRLVDLEDDRIYDIEAFSRVGRRDMVEIAARARIA